MACLTQKRTAPDTGCHYKKISMQLAYHAAPLIQGTKPANLISAERGEFSDISDVLKGTDIDYLFFQGKGEKILLFLYRKRELLNILSLEEEQKFLKNLGYQGEELGEVFRHLSKRLTAYYTGTGEFPHELGIFLGYPLGDVLGFIENKGKNYLLSGYWKVYQNAAKAKELFSLYDKQRGKVMREVASGRSITDIAV